MSSMLAGVIRFGRAFSNMGWVGLKNVLRKRRAVSWFVPGLSVQNENVASY